MDRSNTSQSRLCACAMIWSRLSGRFGWRANSASRSNSAALMSMSFASAPSRRRSSRSSRQAPGRRVAFGACQLDIDQRRLFGGDGAEIEITAAEFDLLALFARHPNRPLNRDQIMEQAHNRGWDVFDRSIDLRIMRLRRKIERNPDKPELLKTVRNVGYVFVPTGTGPLAG